MGDSLSGNAISKPHMIGAELQKVVQDATEKMANETEAEFVRGLTPINAKGSGAVIS
jgi:hypothetical protein